MMKESDLVCFPLIFSQSNSTSMFVFVSIQIPPFYVWFGCHFSFSPLQDNYSQFGATKFRKSIFTSLFAMLNVAALLVQVFLRLPFFLVFLLQNQNNQEEWHSGLVAHSIKTHQEHVLEKTVTQLLQIITCFCWIYENLESP